MQMTCPARSHSGGVFLDLDFSAIFGDVLAL
jgi:hypothetical protein